MIAGLTAVGLAATGFVASRFLDSGEDTSKDKTPVAVGPVVPGTEVPVEQAPSEQPTPSPTASETAQEGAPLSPLEIQAKQLERVDLPDTAISVEDLQPLIDPNALDIYKGVNGGVGLYPEIQAGIDSQRGVFFSMNAEDIAAELDRLDRVITGTYLDVVDGKVVSLPNTTLMQDGIFREPTTKESIAETTEDMVKELGNSLETKSAAVASTLARIADDETGLKLMSKLLEAEGRVAEQYVTNPDEQQQVAETNEATIGEATYLAHGNVNPSAVEARTAYARNMMLGTATYDPLVYKTARIAGVYERKLKNADGTKTSNILGAAIVGQTQAGKSVTMTVALIPAEKIVDSTGVKNAPENAFHVVLIGKFTNENKN